jgi:hypothetical protein
MRHAEIIVTYISVTQGKSATLMKFPSKLLPWFLRAASHLRKRHCVVFKNEALSPKTKTDWFFVLQLRTWLAGLYVCQCLFVYDVLYLKKKAVAFETLCMYVCKNKVIR